MKTIGVPITIEKMHAGSFWKLVAAVNCFDGPISAELATQAVAGRSLQLIHDFPKDASRNNQLCRIEVRLLEDGYRCWIDLSEILSRSVSCGSWKPQLFPTDQIEKRIPNVLTWIEKAAGRNNQYLWGGTIGPDFDCSGLVQAAFASQGIWLPRDAYQQERFCKNLEISLTNYQMLLPGDLIFFGLHKKCTHVAIYLGDGVYCHSSGIQNGRNGIGCDGIEPFDENPVANYYRSQFLSAGRVLHSYDGTSFL